ncbi:polyphenol oxidase [Carex littledalei]|uniref:Polyphenol oxidase n=1 Tax=Carex littledalei TaxID=544730 RepID=A0A833R0A1_9POAL|nr:polyphenol oxidase [Carex littledalei]
MATCRVGFMATSACPVQRERRLRERRVRLIPPRASTSSNNNGPANKFSMDRRDVLLGLGGAAAAATVMTPGGVILPAMANPVAPPDLSKCHIATQGAPSGEDKCCPPYSMAEIIDYDFPRTPLRVRRPAHEVKEDTDYMNKYREAVKKMKELKSDHPWNFYQQALVHCAYCNGAYDQVGYPGVALQVHYSWLFLPWHRYYLHFFERILGKLIDDDTFTLPYWNFDVKEGMTMPEIFTSDENSPLYNKNSRNKDHYHPKLLDYRYGYKAGSGSNASSDDELVQLNMSYMRSTFKNSMQLPELFMGDPLRAGEPDSSGKGSGGLEGIHNGIHQFVGPTTNPHTDMGNFATAARDCMFYSLHANVDRLWHLYRNFRGNRVEFNEPDWLDASFVFYDEHERVVRVKVKDCLTPTKLRYTYEEVPIPWMGSIKVQKTKETKRKQDLNLVRISEFGTQPREIGTTPLRVMVPRPKANRRKKDKEEKVELLQIKDIQVASHGPARFDVFVAAPYGDLAGPDFGEFVGSFVKLPHKTTTEEGNNGVAKHNGKKTNLKLGLTALLEDIEAEDAEKLVVTIVPAGGDVTIGGIQLKLVQADSPRLH